MGNDLDFESALRSFTGYLEGSGRSLNTLKNYRWDLLYFKSYLEKEEIRFETLELATLDRYASYLKAEGLKTNTRRRRLITLHRFIEYLGKRKKIPLVLDRKILTPHKIERVPFVMPYEKLIVAIQHLGDVNRYHRNLPGDIRREILDLSGINNELVFRNRLLLWILAETGCLVSEVCRLRWSDFQTEVIEFHGKGSTLSRKIAVSPSLFEAAMQYRRIQSERGEWLFRGFNKFGVVGSGPMTPRGVEILVCSLRERFEELLGLSFEEEFTPRTFRHSLIVYWMQQGINRSEIQRRLGLRSPYIFKNYEKLVRSTS